MRGRNARRARREQKAAEREALRLQAFAKALGLEARLNDSRAVDAAEGLRGGIQCRVKNIRPIQVTPRKPKVVHYRDLPGVMKVRNRRLTWRDVSDKETEYPGRTAVALSEELATLTGK